jgi:hypothetical protein
MSKVILLVYFYDNDVVKQLINKGLKWLFKGIESRNIQPGN